MKRINRKKGFTIVELVIVIAVIGILAAILIPTFVNLTAQANRVSNESFVKNINTKLAMDDASKGKNKTAYDAMKSAQKMGFYVDEITPYEGNDIVWDETNDRYAIVKGDFATNRDMDHVVFADASFNPSTPLHKLWKFYQDFDFSSTTQTYSIIAKSGWEKTEINNLKVGFDIGENTGLKSIAYTGNAGNSVTIRTSGNLCEFTVYAPNDHVDHHGYAKVTNVVAVNKNNSYHEYGTTNELLVSSGKVVVENTGVVFEMKEAAFAGDPELEIPEVAIDASNDIKNNGGNVMDSEVESVPSSTSFEINNLPQLNSFRDATNSGETFEGKTINLNTDIHLDGPWTPISNYYRKGVATVQGGKVVSDKKVDKFFAGTFNGNKHTIYGLTNKGIQATSLNTGYNSTTPSGQTEVTYGFFGSVNNAIIKDLTFKDVNIVQFNTLLGDCVAACVGFYNNTKTDGSFVGLENIDVNGSIQGYDNVAAVVGMVRNQSDDKVENKIFNIKDCDSDVNIKAIRRGAGIAAQLGSGHALHHMNNCTAKGTISSNYNEDFDHDSADYYICAGLATWGQAAEFKATSCESTATATASNEGGGKACDFVIAEKVGTSLAYATGKWDVTENGRYQKSSSEGIQSVSE